MTDQNSDEYEGEVALNDKLKMARQRLREATRKEFEMLLYEAMLTPLQEEILVFHIVKGIGLRQIAERKGYSESGVRKILNQSYEKVAKVCS